MTSKERRENASIREHLGYRRVRIQADDEVHVFGSRDPVDRSKDFWAFAGYRLDLLAEIDLQVEIEKDDDGKAQKVKAL